MDIRRKVLNLKTASVALTLAAAFIMSSRADTPGAHPAYIHARNDLRRARLYVEVKDSPEVHDHLHYARIEIDKAIAEIDHAAAMDHKAIIDTPDIDATLDRPGRLHKAVDLLRSARARTSVARNRTRLRSSGKT